MTTGLKSEFLSVMKERGFIHQSTDVEGLDAALALRSAGYVGFDATAPSLHVGHLLPLMALRWFARTGNDAIALVGGATTMIGDPSFRNSARPILSKEQIKRNVAGISDQIAGIIADTRIRIVDNAEWLGDLPLLDFLRDIASEFTVSKMLSLESVKSRLGAGLTAMEFSYMMLQAADFAELARRCGCILQIGGSDQWGNICNGIELTRRKHKRTLFGLTTPLLESAPGVKMGKTAGGAVWLNSEMLDVDAFWQFWRNTDDVSVPRFLRLFTELPMDEVERLSSLKGNEINEAKKALATEVTGIVHGRPAAIGAQSRAEAIFVDEIADPTHQISSSGPLSITELLVRIGFANSKSQARKLIQGRGVRIDGLVVANEHERADAGRILNVSVGRRRRAVVAVSR